MNQTVNKTRYDRGTRDSNRLNSNRHNNSSHNNNSHNSNVNRHIMKTMKRRSLGLRKIVNDKILQGFCLTSAFFATTPVLADLPTAGDVVPTGVSEDSPIELGTQLIRIAIQFLAVIIGAGVTLGVGAQVYKSFSEAKEKNGWEDFIKTAAIGVFVIVAVDALAILAFTYASAFTFVV